MVANEELIGFDKKGAAFDGLAHFRKIIPKDWPVFKEAARSLFDEPAQVCFDSLNDPPSYFTVTFKVATPGFSEVQGFELLRQERSIKSKGIRVSAALNGLCYEIPCSYIAF